MILKVLGDTSSFNDFVLELIALLDPFPLLIGRTEGVIRTVGYSDIKIIINGVNLNKLHYT